MKITKLTLLLLAMMTSFSACQKDDDDVDDHDDHDHEEELITSLELIFTDESSKTTTFRFADPDGDGGNGPTEFDTIVLAANSTYTLDIELLNESESPAEDLTHEVEEEGDEHLFCFTASGADVTVTAFDSDGTYAIGLNSSVATGDAGTGTLTVALKHQPGVKDGTCTPGETDIEVAFPIKIQ